MPGVVQLSVEDPERRRRLRCHVVMDRTTSTTAITTKMAVGMLIVGHSVPAPIRASLKTCYGVALNNGHSKLYSA